MTDPIRTPRAAKARRTPVQLTALTFAIVFVVIGVLGFIPGITTDFAALGMAGHESQAMLFGVFQVSVLHNVVHLALGLVGLWFAGFPRTAAGYLVWGGVIYAVIWVYGLFVGQDSTANFVPLNQADNWLHLVLAVAMIVLGVVLPRRGDVTTAGTTTP